MNIETNKKKKQIAILGSTGSIGTQALQVIEEHPDLYEAYALTANNRVELLIAQARKFQPEVVVIANEEKYSELKEALSDLPIKVYAGTDAICQIVEAGPIDMVLTAMVGYAGLKPTINAIRAKKAIALANKETLVVAGELINQLAQQYRTPILPVDSEHSAVFQCLAGEVGNPIEKVILTASGGPFRTYTLEQLKSVTKTQALKHPNWEMGAKITIDSASMMNKGFEVIREGKSWKIPEDARKPQRKKRAGKVSTDLLTRLKQEKDSAISGGIYHKVQIELTYNSNHMEGRYHDEYLCISAWHPTYGT